MNLFLLALVMIAVGIAQLCVPLDMLWQRQERYLLRRGMAAQRSEVWEQGARNQGWYFIGIGVLVLIGGMVIGASAPQKMSGTTFDGHEFTQTEWDACNHNIEVCASLYAQRHAK